MKRLLFFVLLLLGQVGLLAQQSELFQLQAQRQEFYFSLPAPEAKTLAELSKLISIDEILPGKVIGYTNPEQYAKLLGLGFEPELLLPPGLQIAPEELRMLDVDELAQKSNWDFYPTYPAYVSMMQEFQTIYPNLCTIHNIGTLNSGRQLLVARINNGNPIGKPQFLYTSTMHGDETTGYVLMLRLIHYLLSNYGINPRVTSLVDQMDIWINPLANPDGTYWGGNNTVFGSRRGNANNVDLNRNYPDPLDGPHPDGNPWQAETQAFMNFADQHNFVMAANFHGGIEVINYPWDTWQRRHADDNWWIYVSREYADTAHVNSPAGYMTAFNNGITNGYDWYRVSGGRQDYMNYFQNCRELTAEISNTKTLPAAQLPAHWNYNYRSLLNYMNQALYGIHGTVTDSLTGQAVAAKVEVIGHELDNSHVFSALPAGNYHRPIKAGTYNLKFTATGYHPRIINNVSVADKQKVVVDVQLVPGVIIADFTASAYSIPKGGSVNFTDASYGQNIVSWEWQFPGANPSSSTLQNPTNIVYPNAGSFDVQLTVTNANGDSHTVLKPNLINVTSQYIMGNGQYYTCEGTFYDPGGPNGNYGNNQEFIATFFPDTNEALMRVQFTDFDLEASATCAYDWLKIYNGASTMAPLLGTWCGTNSPGTITASNPQKALTFHFKSDGSVVRSGWAANLSCFSTVDLKEKQNARVTISPNPVQDGRINIESDTPLLSVTIKDYNGRMLRQISANADLQLQLETNNLKSGIYLLEAQTIKGKIIQKMVIQ
ncbi:MAG: carboxypeptidase regulatory-like domain-containing protein [Bacteroidetes bacterium]|nr:carboxypeptidase regulatory-like domain-containing protein [Bacteroidota bacterium]